MQAFMGRNPNISEVETNLQAYFAVAWDRMAVECGWDAGRVPSRSVKTVYGWLRERPTAMKKLQDSKLILPATFEIQMAVDARNAREAERFRALDVGHPPIHHQNHHHTPLHTMLTAPFFQVPPQSSGGSALDVGHPPIHHQTPPYTMLTAVYFRLNRPLKTASFMSI